MKHVAILGFFLFAGAYSCNWFSANTYRFPTRGIDVSHYQSTIHWEEVSQQGIQFVFVKATEGREFNDSLFSRNWAAIRQVGLKRGAYHFFRGFVPAEEQAKNFIRSVAMEPGDLPPVLDVETRDGLSKPEFLAHMQTWLFMVEIAYGIKPIIYTNQKFYNANLAGYFDDYPLWIARYGAKTPRLSDGRKWLFWQHKDTGKMKGIDGNVDMNVFQGDLADLEKLCLQPRHLLSLR
jgi:lysozyme